MSVAGVAVGIIVGFERSPAVGVAAAASGGLLLGFRRRPSLTLIGLVVCAFGCGWISISARSDASELVNVAADVPRCEFTAEVLEQAGGLGTFVSVTAAACAGPPSLNGVAVLGDEATQLEPGSTLVGEGWILPLSDDPFDRARRRMGAEALLDPTGMQVSPPAAHHHRIAAWYRDNLRDSIRNLPREREGLLLGLTIGDTSRLPPTTIEAFRRSGLTHLLAVSGSNVAIVLAFVGLSVRMLSYRARLTAALGALAFFVLVVGPDASVLRAATMGAIATLAFGWVRRVEPLHSLGLAILCVLAIRPALTFSTGLHLSVAATIGIVLWSVPLERKLGFLPRLISLPLAVTCAAQLAVAPILLATFGTLSTTAPLANVFAVAAVAPATVAGLGAGLASGIHPLLGETIVACVDPLLRWLLFVAELAARPESALVKPPTFTAGLAGLLVGCLAIKSLINRDRTRDYSRGVAGFLWKLNDASGQVLRSTEEFATKDEAESWMGEHWAELLDEGAETVTLMDGDTQLYEMGLRAE
jgi:ComEC/Rec2-related protein